MRIKHTKRPYKGCLAEPIYAAPHLYDLSPLPSVGILGNYEAAQEKASQRAWEQIAEKFELLFAHYEIDIGDDHKWVKLSLALATDHVPGMRVIHSVPRKRGRRRTWKAGLGDTLIDDVAAMRHGNKITIRDALSSLHKDTSKPWRRFAIQSLEARYREAKNRRALRQRMVQALARTDMPSGSLFPLIGGLFGLGAADLKSVSASAGPLPENRTDEK